MLARSVPVDDSQGLTPNPKARNVAPAAKNKAMCPSEIVLWITSLRN